MKQSLKLLALSFLMIATATWQAQARTLVPKQDPKKGTWGYVEPDNDKWVVKPRFEKAEDMRAMPNGKTRAFVTLKSKMGLLDENGNTLGAGIVFEDTVRMSGNAMMVTVKGKKGVIDFDGQYIVKPEIENIEPMGKEGFLVTIKGKKGILRHDATFLLDPVYKNIDTSLPDWFVVNLGGKAGLLTRDGLTTKISPKDFTNIEPFGNLWKVYNGEKVGLYDISSQQLLTKPEHYDVKEPMRLNKTNLLVVADKSGKWGIVTPEGKKIAKPEFTDIVLCPGGDALLLYDGSNLKKIYFANDNKPRKVVDSEFAERGPFSIARITFSRDWQNHRFDVVTLPDGTKSSYSPEDIKMLNNFVYIQTGANVFTIFDLDGNIIVRNCPGQPQAYANWLLLKDKAVAPDKKTYDLGATIADVPIVTDAHGNTYEILSNGSLNGIGYPYPIYTDRSDLAKIVKRNGKWGLDDIEKGTSILPCEYDSIAPVDATKINGQPDYRWVASVLVKKDGKFGLYNLESQKLVLNPEHDKIVFNKGNQSSTKRPYYMVYSGGKIGLFMQNQWKVPLSNGYETMELLSPYNTYDSDMTLLVSRNGKYGIVRSFSYNSEYKEIVPLVYAEGNIVKDGYFLTCSSGNKVRYFNLAGDEFSGSPRVEGKTWYTHGTTYGGHNASFMNFNLEFHLMQGRSFTLYMDIYNAAGRRIDQYNATYSIDKPYYSTSDSYFTVPHSDLPVAAWSKEDFTVKFRLVDDRTGKEIPFKGNKKLAFWVRRG